MDQSNKGNNTKTKPLDVIVLAKEALEELKNGSAHPVIYDRAEKSQAELPK